MSQIYADKWCLKLTEVKEKTPWIPLILISFLAGVLGTFWAAFLPASLIANHNIGVIWCALDLTPLPFLFILFYKFGYLRKRINATSTAYLYVTGITASHFVGRYFPWWEVTHYSGGRIANPALSEMIYSGLLAPPADVCQQMPTGGVPIPWGAWIAPLAYWWAVTVLFAAFFGSIASIFRRWWIDIERVPFPQTMIAHELIINEGGGEVTAARRRNFLIGIALGMIFQIPIFMTNIFPWFPDIYGWRANTCATGAGQLTTDSPLAGIIGLAMYMKSPVYGAVLYLAPLLILFNAWFWYAVFVVLMQVAYAMGYYTAIPSMGGCGRVWCGGQDYWAAEPFKWNAFSNIGGGVGLVLFYMFLNRRYIVETFNAAVGRLGAEKIREIEAKEAITYRGAYAILFASLVLLTACFMAIGLSPLPALMIPMTAFLCFMMGSYVYARVGYGIAYNNVWGVFLFKLLWPTMPANPSPEWYVGFAMSGQLASDGPQYGWGASAYSSFASLRMGSLTDASNKKIMTVWVIASVVTPIAAMLTALWASYAFGTSRIAIVQGYNSCFDIDCCMGYGANVAGWPANEPWIYNALAGFIFVGALSVLHARFVWFPFEPVGFLLATAGRPLLDGIWTMCLIAWMLKALTLRIGGSKAYEGLGVPVASGFVVGVIISTFAGGAIGVARFFVPF